MPIVADSLYFDEMPDPDPHQNENIRIDIRIRVKGLDSKQVLLLLPLGLKGGNTLACGEGVANSDEGTDILYSMYCKQ
jgi:hypothetical protein